MPKDSKTTGSMSAMVHIGMIMTISSVLAAQFVKNTALEFALIAIALVGILLSLAPFWAGNAKDWRQALRRMIRHANVDEHMWDTGHDAPKHRQPDDDNHNADDG